ncbi:biphenyl-2,3-diol 1,2-dioxygenase [Desulfolithobacter dissulfuricans]|uniref:Biphenyl-2,3-diol 1,2-dioxygenase n=1 Tax=Desulfolithobacter dissulfuricans TaxID=2795293 RepID=A0A915U068_9BACT|nr:VOC family protein [Desulfolithobacter dissulfuricans]BCO07982.1 biphenyl-2,3-diol 1,2-dioxygenase [Desulfolithobacter dissulfuricans]
MEISGIDHFVLTVSDIDETVAFYEKVLGMDRVVFGAGRVALKFGNQKINLHEVGHELEPKAKCPAPGSADLCFLTPLVLNEALRQVKQCGVEIIEGPVERTGANRKLLSFYFRDPSGNLIEVANEV